MKTKMKIALLGLVAAPQMACSFYARSAEDYEKDTTALIRTKEKEMRECYDAILKQDKEAKGTLVVTFNVAVKTGEITNPKVDEAKTTAPESVHACVLDALTGLKLDPPDQREGDASYTYEFRP